MARCLIWRGTCRFGQHDALLPGARSAVMVTMDYLSDAEGWQAKEEAACLIRIGQWSRSMLAPRLSQGAAHRLSVLARKMQEAWGPWAIAPVWTRPDHGSGVGAAGRPGLARQTHLLLSRAELHVLPGNTAHDRPLPATAPVSNHCGSCTACLVACPHSIRGPTSSMPGAASLT